MKNLLLILLLATSYSYAPSAAANPDKPAECVTSWDEGKKTFFQNNCSYWVYIIYCDTSRGKSKRVCGYKGGYYTHSFSLKPGDKRDKYVHPNLDAGMRGMPKEWSF
jgi:hypothetical protein